MPNVSVSQNRSDAGCRILHRDCQLLVRNASDGGLSLECGAASHRLSLLREPNAAVLASVSWSSAMFRTPFATLAPFRTVLFAAGAGMALTAPPSALAEDPINIRINTCTTLNCGSDIITGRFNAQGTQSNPWVGLFWLEAGSSYCARLQIDKQSLNTEMSVVSPNGSVYTSDNGGGTCSFCPRVVISPVSLRGAYTVVINQYLGSAVEGGFRLRASQYALGNPNCSSPTPPLPPRLSIAEKAKIGKAKGN